MRINTHTILSLHEAILHIDDTPQTVVVPAEPYTQLLEVALMTLCNKYDLDFHTLLVEVQTLERSAQTKRSPRAPGREERASKKVYGKDGKVVAKSAAEYFKMYPNRKLETSQSYYNKKTDDMD